MNDFTLAPAPDRRVREIAIAQREALHPFGAGPRLSRAATAYEEPVSPTLRVRRQLLPTRLKIPHREDRPHFRGRASFEKLMDRPLLH